MTAGGRPPVPNHTTDKELMKDVNWRREMDETPVQVALHSLEYGNDNYSTGVEWYLNYF